MYINLNKVVVPLTKMDVFLLLLLKYNDRIRIETEILGRLKIED